MSGKLFCVLNYLKYIHPLRDCIKSIVKLSLSSCSDYAKVFENLQHNWCVKTLVLGSNFCLSSDDWAVGNALKRMLVINNVLESLQCHQCHITDSMSKCLATGLTHNTSLKRLSLSHHGVHSYCGIINIIKALQHNRRLEKLDLSDNQALLVKDNNKLLGFEIEQFLKANTTLIELNLCETYIDDTIAAGMAKGLRVNMGLKKLEVTFASLTSHGAAMLFLH